MLVNVSQVQVVDSVVFVLFFWPATDHTTYSRLSTASLWCSSNSQRLMAMVTDSLLQVVVRDVLVLGASPGKRPVALVTDSLLQVVESVVLVIS